MSAHEYDNEPTPGLPARLPEGENVLWQGAPDWAAFAVHALHVRFVTFYFALATIAQPLIAAARSPGDKLALATATGEAVLTAAIGAIAVAMLCGFAVAVSRTTLYTLTNRRLVIRAGVAIAKMVNLPFAIIETAGLRTHANGVGDLALTLRDGHRASYLLLWPHVRPWRLNRPQPMLRTVADAERVARLLAESLLHAATAQPITKATPFHQAQAARPQASPNNAAKEHVSA